MSPLAEEIATTLEILNHDVGSESVCFQEDLFIFQISVFAKLFYKNIRKSKKKNVSEQKTIKNKKHFFLGILPCVILISGKACCFLVIFFLI